MNSLETITETLVKMGQEISSYSGSLAELETAASGASAAVSALQDKAVLAQEHKHGVADPACPGCSAVVEESLDGARKEVVTYYHGIPGVTKLQEIWEEQQAFRRELKAKGEDPDQEIVTII